jgi:galactose mutarotase-like enzyme
MAGIGGAFSMSEKLATVTQDWNYKGMRTLILENEFLRIVFLLDKGSDMIELRYKPLDIDLMWHSPQGHVNPKEYVASIVTQESSFNDLYGGGWQDALPVIGNGPQEAHGAKYGTHGETPVIPWSCKIDEEAGSAASAIMSVKGVRYPFQLEKKVQISKDESRLTIRETLTNTAPQDLEFFWLQHPSFGAPFLAPGDQIALPVGSEIENFVEINPNGRVGDGKFRWPKAMGKQLETNEIDLSLVPPKDLVAEETNFVRVKEGWYSLTNPKIGLQFRLDWDSKIFPWLWFWQNYNLPNYPYYGEAWNIALEPATSLPANLARQRGEEGLKISGKSSITTELTASIDRSK